LLDWLAADFIRSGWSVKHLHRVIILGSAFQQSSLPGEGRRLVGRKTPSPVSHDTSRRDAGALTAEDLDPENKLLSHFPRRRLDFEAMRDTLLTVSGQLNSTIGGPSVDISDTSNHRRTVYGLVDRQNLAGLFRAFDFPVPDQCAEKRPKTIVPQQALFGLNSAFVMEQAKEVVSRAEIAMFSNPGERIDALFRRVYARHASKEEVARCLEFVGGGASTSSGATGLSPWELLAQVLLISNEAVFLD
jgi:hypothetical protein